MWVEYFIISLMALGQLAQQFFDWQNLPKNFTVKIWKIPKLRSFVPTVFEFEKRTPKVLGQLAQQSLVP